MRKRPRAGEADQPPSDRAKLKFIFERYNHYASGTDNSPASKLALRMLQHNVKQADSDSPKCMLCLETVQTGDAYTVLPCGHVFHQGDASCSGESGSKNGNKGRCKGIIYWLNENCACPTCRHELDRKFKKPTEEERLLIPIIKRQNSCLKLQEQLVQVQRRELVTLRNEVRQKAIGNANNVKNQSVSVSSRSHGQSNGHGVRPVLSKETKKEILVCVINSFGNNVAMNINNLETLSVIVSKVEREVLKRAGVASYTPKSSTLRSLIQESLKEIKGDKVGPLLRGDAIKRTGEERRRLEPVTVTE